MSLYMYVCIFMRKEDGMAGPVLRINEDRISKNILNMKIKWEHPRKRQVRGGHNKLWNIPQRKISMGGN